MKDEERKEYMRKYMKRYYRKKYYNDPEFRRKLLESNRRWRERNKDYFKKRYRETRGKYLQKFTIGLECKNCGFKIKTFTGGRFLKQEIKCPNCGMRWKKFELEKVIIEREL